MDAITREIENETAFFKTLDTLPSAIVVADIHTHLIVWLNPAAEQLMGRTQADTIGLSQQILHPPLMNLSTMDTFSQQKKQLKTSTSATTLRNILLHLDGTQIPVEIAVNPVQVNQQTFMVGIFTPIKQLLATQEQLEIKRIEWQSIFDNSQVGIMIVDDQRVIRQINQRLVEILGYDSPTELQGQSVEIIHINAQSYLDFGAQYFEKLITQKALYIEYLARKKSGETIWCRISGKSHTLETLGGTLQGAVWVIDDINDMKETEQMLLMERELFTNGPTTILQWQASEGWPIVYASKNVINTLGYSVEELLHPDFRFFSLIHPQDLAMVEADVMKQLAQHQTHYEQSFRIRTLSGEYRHFYDYSQVHYDADGTANKIYGYLMDMTDYLKAQEMSNLLLRHSTEGIFGIDINGNTSFVNPAALKMLGYREDEILHKNNHNLFHHTKGDGTLFHAEECRMSMPLKTGLDYYVNDEVLWRKDGTFFAIEYWSTPILQDDVITGTVVTFHDISVRVNQEQKMHHLAYHDPLTGLPNRRQLLNQLHQTLLEQEKNHTQNASLMILDIDHFKEVNDTLGHPTGDALLKAITERVKILLHEIDTFARIGGDEFAILIVDDLGGLRTLKLAQDIIDSFKESFKINHKTIQSNTSIGVSLCQTGLSVEQIISQADIALYEAKNLGRGTFVFYELTMIDKVNNDLKLFNGLTQALNKHEFSLHYQLQFDALTLKPCGAEMLIRWHPCDSELDGFSSPDVFIKMAEKRGLLQSIALWQLDVLIQDIQKLKHAGLVGRVSINISGCQLSSLQKMRDFIQKIQLNGLDLHDLEFEITETTYAKLTESMKELLNLLQNQGLSIAIDDFGTGYSSLVALRELQSNILKIDKQFIDELETNQDDRAIVSATIVMAHALGKRVVAEGVETQYQSEFLQSLSCDILQGYYLARPEPIEDVCQYLKTGHHP